MTIKNELLGRLYLVTALLAVVAFVILGQAARIQIQEGDKWRAKGNANYLKKVNVKAERGNILSEDGLLLASSMPFYEVRFDLKAAPQPLFEKYVDTLGYHLAHMNTARQLNVEDYQKLLRVKREEGARYLLIAKNVGYNDLQKFKSLPIFDQGRYRGGFIAEKQSRRERPFGQLARRTIGIDRDTNPVGIEGYYDDVLSGKEGKQLMERIPTGISGKNIYVPVNDLTLVAPEKGEDVVTTLDIDLQDVLHEALKNGLQYHQAEYGSAILMDVKTGAIKAISNLGETQYGYIEDYNYAVGRATEPGSTFKLATMLSLLEDSHVDLHDMIDVELGQKEFYDRKMFDSSEHGYDTITVAKAFAISSNVGIAKLAVEHYSRDAGAKDLYENLKSMGLTDLSGIEIQGEAKPMIKDPNDPDVYYSGTTIPWMAHGYELTMTPLQILSLYASVANGGKKMKPYIVKGFAKEGKMTRKFYPRVEINRIASKRTIAKAQRLLELVVEEGTAEGHRSSRYNYAGKTGTAVTNYAKRGVASKYQASFAGYFPAENPKYACIVTINTPKRGGIYGSSVALPIFRAIADKCFSMKPELMPYVKSIAQSGNHGQFVIGANEDLKWLTAELGYNLEKTTTTDFGVLTGIQDSILIRPRSIARNTIPNVVGMGARDAVYLLENEGLKVRIRGIGKVKQQSIKPGTEAVGQNIYLRLG